jgi:hypothetical protein
MVFYIVLITFHDGKLCFFLRVIFLFLLLYQPEEEGDRDVYVTVRVQKGSMCTSTGLLLLLNKSTNRLLSK